ncbi:hypothetical protein [Nostoc sp.]|uniref:hypothetical protein n=1 Tax=Nostoc sp. TaxID=1180 RepID=UPI002FF5C594
MKTATSGLFYEKNSHQSFGCGRLSNAYNSNADGSTHLGQTQNSQAQEAERLL